MRHDSVIRQRDQMLSARVRIGKCIRVVTKEQKLDTNAQGVNKWRGCGLNFAA